MSDRTVIRMILPIAPVAKERPRLGRGSRVYTPKRTKSFENALALLAKMEMRKLKRTPLGGALRVQLAFILKPPKRPKSIYPCSRPDLDNYIKSTLDALNGIVWKDDATIVDLVAQKYYNRAYPEAKISLTIWELSEEEPKNGLIPPG